MAAQEEPELGRYPDGTTCLPAWKEPLPLNKMPTNGWWQYEGFHYVYLKVSPRRMKFNLLFKTPALNFLTNCSLLTGLEKSATHAGLCCPEPLTPEDLISGRLGISGPDHQMELSKKYFPMFRVAPSFSIEKDTKALLGKKPHSLEGEVCMPAPPSRVTAASPSTSQSPGLACGK